MIMEVRDPKGGVHLATRCYHCVFVCLDILRSSASKRGLSMRSPKTISRVVMSCPSYLTFHSAGGGKIARSGGNHQSIIGFPNQY